MEMKIKVQEETIIYLKKFEKEGQEQKEENNEIKKKITS